jgi:tRNA(Ile)-lysidine synthase
LDSTNDDCHYTRNRLRAEVIPLLRSRFNPQVERHLAQTADLLQEEAAWLASLSASWLAAHVDQADRLDRQALRAEHLALQRRAIRQWLSERSGRSPTYSQVMAVMALVDAPNRSQTESFAGGAQVVANDRWLEWLPPAAPTP